MNAEELIEAVSKMTAGEWCWGYQYICQKLPAQYVRLAKFTGRGTAPEGSQWEWDAAGIVALRNHAVPLLQSLISERDAALARAAELEAREDGLTKALRDFAALQKPIDPEILKAATSSDMWKLYARDDSNVRDAGPTPYSGRTTRRER